jgi:hypothetical protein
LYLQIEGTQFIQNQAIESLAYESESGELNKGGAIYFDCIGKVYECS